MGEDIYDFILAGTRTRRQVGINMRKVTSVEELSPFQEVDNAYCRVFVEGIVEPYRLVVPFKQVFDIWKRVTSREER